MTRKAGSAAFAALGALALGAVLWACNSGRPSAQGRCAGDLPGVIAESGGDRIALGRSATRVTLTSCNRRPMDAAIRALPPGRRVLLLVEDLRADAPPGVIYDVELGPARRGDDVTLGSLNFFAARNRRAGGRPRAVSYDVTAVVRRLADENRLGAAPALTLAPADAPAPGAMASVGRVRLAVQ